MENYTHNPLCINLYPPVLTLPPPVLPTVMEKYTRNARFCLICNYVSKIIPALQSRCTRFRFQPLPHQFVQSRLEQICAQERCAGVRWSAVGWGLGEQWAGAGWGGETFLAEERCGRM